jgi:diadenosine tetraphosphate (Ap4A) HIT family hydrolase
MSTDCPFCTPPTERIWFQDATVLAFHDGYPISPGHTLVIPRRHVKSVFDLETDELAHLWAKVRNVRQLLKEQFQPDAFNIGINDGQAAGQTVPHAHIHVIPRFKGDVHDPRGGIRWIMAEKAAYWSQ